MKEYWHATVLSSLGFQVGHERARHEVVIFGPDRYYNMYRRIATLRLSVDFMAGAPNPSYCQMRPMGGGEEWSDCLIIGCEVERGKEIQWEMELYGKGELKSRGGTLWVPKKGDKVVIENRGN